MFQIKQFISSSFAFGINYLIKLLRVVSLTFINFSVLISLKDFFKSTLIVLFMSFYLLPITKFNFFKVLSSISYIITSFSDNLKHKSSSVWPGSITFYIAELSTFLIKSSTTEI